MLIKDAKHLDQDRARLMHWFELNQREVPWRKDRNPYRIWIAEVMLQQTTTAAVIPFYLKFMQRFPSLAALAKAPVQLVLESWAGLGYYSRAKNLKLAAEQLANLSDFPKSYRDLLALPGFGPYTARAVSSQAFEEPVGVVDGNVIRVLSRYFDWPGKWWTTSGRNELQEFTDQWVQGVSSNLMNQALMELGSTVCVASSPSCGLCPLASHCCSLKKHNQLSLPLKKPKRDREIWIWKAEIHQRNGKVALEKIVKVPFLKNHFALPGQASRASQPPKKFSFKHSITHHDIYVILKVNPKAGVKKWKWVKPEHITRYTPLSLVRKAVQHEG